MNLTTIKKKHHIINVIVLLLIIFLMVIRRQDIIAKAQIWAEDGSIWLRDAYNVGIFSVFFMPQIGFFQTILSLTHSIAIFFDLSKAAFIINLISILIIAWFIVFILSGIIKFPPLIYGTTVKNYIILMLKIAEYFPNITNMKCRLKKYGLHLGISSLSRSLPQSL